LFQGDIVDVRIGITQVAREVELDMADDTRPDTVAKINAALASAEGVLELVDKKGRTVVVAAAKIAYVEIGGSTEERKVGFAR
jgi:hypothetical protein